MKTARRPVDVLLVTFNLAMTLVWFAKVGTIGAAPLFAGAHVLAALLVLALLRFPPASRPWAIALREAYPLTMIGLGWVEVGMLHQMSRTIGYDALVSAIDLRIFGVHPHETWMPAMPGAPFATLMFGFYLGYYLLVFGLPLALGALRKRQAFEETVFRLLLTYLVCDLLYTVFPVLGPRFTSGFTMEAGGWLGRFAESLVASGDAPGTAFPSSHVAGAVTAAVIAWRRFPRTAALFWTFCALGVTLSTVYTRNHYAVDALGGVALALVLQLGIAPALESRMRPSAHASFRPTFPRLLPDAVQERVRASRRIVT